MLFILLKLRSPSGLSPSPGLTLPSPSALGSDRDSVAAQGSGWLREDTGPQGRGRGRERHLLFLVSSPQRFSMEGISSILQSSIRQTFGSSGTDKQVRLSPWSPRGLPSGAGSGGSIG